MQQTDRSSVRSSRRRWYRGGLLVTAAVLAFTAFGAGTASAANLASDDFEDGTASGWTTTGGTWLVAQDGTLVLRQASMASNALARTGQPGWNDYTITAQVKAGSFYGLPGFVGVVARAQSTSNYYALVLRPNDTLALTRTIGGSSTVLASAPVSVEAGTWYTLRLTVNDREISGSANGVRVSASDSFNLSGPAGLVTTWTTASFDNVSIDS